MNEKLNINQIIENVLSGDTRSYSIIIDNYKNLVFTLACKILKNHEDAQDLTQEVFIKVFSALNTFKKDANFSTWIYSITYNLAISQIRMNKTQKRFVQTEEINEDMNVKDENKLIDQILINYENINLLNQALNQLDEESNAILTLFYFNESNIEEISNIMNISTSNVKIRLFRARKKLLLILEKKLNNELEFWK